MDEGKANADGESAEASTRLTVDRGERESADCIVANTAKGEINEYVFQPRTRLIASWHRQV